MCCPTRRFDTLASKSCLREAYEKFTRNVLFVARSRDKSKTRLKSNIATIRWYFFAYEKLQSNSKCEFPPRFAAHDNIMLDLPPNTSIDAEQNAPSMLTYMLYADICFCFCLCPNAKRPKGPERSCHMHTRSESSKFGVDTLARQPNRHRAHCTKHADIFI